MPRIPRVAYAGAIYYVTVRMEGQAWETSRERSPLACHAKDMTMKRKQKNPVEFPIATVAFYGPDDRHATKIVVGILKREDSDIDPIMCSFWANRDRWIGDIDE